MDEKSQYFFLIIEKSCIYSHYRHFQLTYELTYPIENCLFFQENTEIQPRTADQSQNQRKKQKSKKARKLNLFRAQKNLSNHLTEVFKQGYKDSNLELTESESVALPFGDSPI